MSLKQIGWFSILAAVMFLTPLLALAQVQIQLPQGWPSRSNEQIFYGKLEDSLTPKEHKCLIREEKQCVA